MKKKTKPSLKDKLSADFVKAYQADFEENGVDVIAALRLKDPAKYAELAARLIAAVEPPSGGYADCESMEDIGIKLLEQVGYTEPSDDDIQEAVDAHEILVEKLQAIAARKELN